MSKVYKDFIPPESGRVYSITAVGDGTSRIEDVTQYVQEGDTWGAADANSKADKPISASATLSSASWQTVEGGFQQQITADWVTETMHVDFYADAETDAALAAAGVKIVPKNASGTLLATIFGEAKPEGDVQIQIVGIEAEVR